MSAKAAAVAAFACAAVAGFFAGGVTRGFGLFAPDDAPAAVPPRMRPRPPAPTAAQRS